MNESYITAILGIVILMTTWVFIQSLWRKTFSEHLTDDDVLAKRNNCSNCGCTTVCHNKKIDQLKNLNKN